MKKVNIVVLFAGLGAAFLAGQLLSPRPDKKLIENMVKERKAYQDNIKHLQNELTILKRDDDDLKNKMLEDSLRYLNINKQYENDITRLQKKVKVIDFGNSNVLELDEAIKKLYQ